MALLQGDLVDNSSVHKLYADISVTVNRKNISPTVSRHFKRNNNLLGYKVLKWFKSNLKQNLDLILHLKTKYKLLLLLDWRKKLDAAQKSILITDQ